MFKTIYSRETSLFLFMQETHKSDYLMNMATAEIKEMLASKYKHSPYATRARSRMRELLATVSSLSHSSYVTPHYDPLFVL